MQWHEIIFPAKGLFKYTRTTSKFNLNTKTEKEYFIFRLNVYQNNVHIPTMHFMFVIMYYIRINTI